MRKTFSCLNSYRTLGNVMSYSFWMIQKIPDSPSGEGLIFNPFFPERLILKSEKHSCAHYAKQIYKGNRSSARYRQEKPTLSGLNMKKPLFTAS